MKQIFIVVVLFFFCFCYATAQTGKVKKVEAAVVQLVQAMESGKADELSAIVSSKLSYGHSNGKVENKAQFVQSFASGASDFVKINILEQTVDVFKNTAIVRHILDADTNDNNKPGHVKLKIMTVWQKAFLGKWKMIARQAVKIAS